MQQVLTRGQNIVNMKRKIERVEKKKKEGGRWCKSWRRK